MASPDVFLSSPLRARRQIAHVAVSSSPELPSVQELLSQKASRPPLKSGSKAAPIPENAITTFTSAGRLWRTLQSETAATSTASPASLADRPAEEIDATPSVIETRPEDVASKRKPRPRKQAAPKRAASGRKGSRTETTPCPELPADSQPWKKYKSPTKPTASNSIESDVVDVIEKPSSQLNSTSQNDKTTSRFFKTTETVGQQVAGSPQIKPVAPDEPLNLEAAMARRVDWTPPTQKVQIILDSDDAPGSEISRSQLETVRPQKFETLLATFKCDDLPQPERNSVPLEEDPTVFRKRKLIELVPGQGNDAADASKPADLPTKKKAPKKKARTITALATAAYRPPTQPEAAAAPDTDHQQPATTMLSLNGNKATKPRKRAPRASKKKEPAPKPILLSPSTALKQSSRQDFVFGTSSQLAREQSPTLLRDLQAVMRASNQLDLVEYTTPLNSDALEAPEKQQSLWDAGARDEDGDLFDVEMRNITERSPGQLRTIDKADPFGYVRHDMDDSLTLPVLPPAGSGRDNDSFMNLSDILPVSCDTGIDDSFINLSDILPAPNDDKATDVAVTSSRALRRELIARSPSPTRERSVTMEGPGLHEPAELTQTEQVKTHTREPAIVTQSYDLYTDAQLAKQVAQYGFKPIKKRAAMIALLKKCGHGGLGTTQGLAPSLSVTTQSSRAASTLTTAATKEKRPRGRPRKVSLSQDESEQPPPSAQACDPPRKPRGRPRKESNPDATSLTVTRTKKSIKTKSPVPTTPKRKGKSSKMVIEIPDSQSDDSEAISASVSSSPEPNFSPPQPVDLSVSLDEDTELSLTMSPTDQQSAMFSCITKAVTTAPRTTDPANPSWHEKILLYDPIVLEDLTTWLNSGQLTRLGWDGEASVGEVKKWCESKSICCLWKVNLRGKERRRY